MAGFEVTAEVKEVLTALDAPEPLKARDLLTREDAVGSFRSWLRELHRYLAEEEHLAEDLAQR